MSSPIKGKNVFVWTDPGSGYKLMCCYKSGSLDFDVEDIPISTVDSGTDEDFDPGFSRAKLSLEQLATVNEANKRHFYEVINDRRSKRQMKVVFTADSGDIVQYEFMAKVTNTGAGGAVGSFANGRTTFTVCGPLTFTLIAAGGGGSFSTGGGTVEVYSDWWTMTPGQNYISGASAIHGYTLAGKNILLVIRTGMPFDFIGYSGTPSGRQAMYNTSLSRLVFDSTLPANPDETVTVVFTD